MYDQGEEAIAPDAVSAELGCGVPTAFADLHPGEVVLDLASGAGADVLIAARRVAPGGKAKRLSRPAATTRVVTEPPARPAPRPREPAGSAVEGFSATAGLAATSRRRVQGAPLAGFARGPHVATPDPAYRRR